MAILFFCSTFETTESILFFTIASLSIISLKIKIYSYIIFITIHYTFNWEHIYIFWVRTHKFYYRKFIDVWNTCFRNFEFTQNYFYFYFQQSNVQFRPPEFNAMYFILPKIIIILVLSVQCIYIYIIIVLFYISVVQCDVKLEVRVLSIL